MKIESHWTCVINSTLIVLIDAYYLKKYALYNNEHSGRWS